MVIRIGLDSLPPFLAAALRFTVAFCALFAYTLANRKPLAFDLKRHLFFIWFGFVNFTAGYACVYWAEQYIGSGLTSVLFSVMPFYVLFLSIRMLPEEHVTLKRLFGILLGFIGIILIFRDQINIAEGNIYFLLAMIVVLIGPLFSALGTISAKYAMKQIDVLSLNTMPLLYTSVNFYLLYFLFERNSVVTFDTKAFFSIFYLGLVGTALAFILYFWLLKTRSAVMMSMITYITPPLALLWGWFVLGEQITLFLLFGLVVIFAGILLARKR
jgi:drug/metabolite transporter (DMT)-like permease